MLHHACKFRPPLYVVRNLFELDTFNASRIDSRGRYPLHLALEHESDVKVVKFLIENNKAAVAAQDVYGQTPLHMVVQQFTEKRERNSLYERNNYLDIGDVISFVDSIEALDLILLLCDAVPSSPLVEDSNGMTALEYAIDVEADCKLVKALQEKMRIAHLLQIKKNRSQLLPWNIGVACAA